MRYLNAFLSVLLTLFTIVQYNDPDASLWVLIYGLPAIWAGLAAYDPGAFAHNHWLLGVLGLNILAIGAGTIYMWPTEITTWWENEEVREGLGLVGRGRQPPDCCFRSLALASARACSG